MVNILAKAILIQDLLKGDESCSPICGYSLVGHLEFFLQVF